MQSRLLALAIGCSLAAFSFGCSDDDSNPPGNPPDNPPGDSACATNSSSFVKTELVFGLDRKGQRIPEEQWQDFVDTTITPAFPDGFSVIDVKGQYRMEDGTIIKEPSKLLVVYHGGTTQEFETLDAIRTKYKERFEQESVLRADDNVCVSF